MGFVLSERNDHGSSKTFCSLQLVFLLFLLTPVPLSIQLYYECYALFLSKYLLLLTCSVPGILNFLLQSHVSVASCHLFEDRQSLTSIQEIKPCCTKLILVIFECKLHLSSERRRAYLSTSFFKCKTCFNIQGNIFVWHFHGFFLLVWLLSKATERRHQFYLTHK